jgi:DNA-directed RNA polymerase specialized sigma24 family protein
MYRMSNSEIKQYQSAERVLQELRIQHAYELQRAYDGIHPTISCFDYEGGSIHSESINPADYAIYLIELKEEHQRQQRWWGLRAEAYKEARKKLTEEEKRYLDIYGAGTYKQKEAARNKLGQALIEIVETKPELRRQTVSLDDIEDMEEADLQIEKMSMEELLKDYWDLDELLNETDLKKRCIYLYEACDWPYREIGKRLGIPTSRVKEYVNSSEGSKPIASKSTPPMVSNVEITYLNAEELLEYRSGKNGGSKWYSYEDYLQMKGKGMNNKEIAVAMGIDPSILFQRLKAWKRSRNKQR